MIFTLFVDAVVHSILCVFVCVCVCVCVCVLCLDGLHREENCLLLHFGQCLMCHRESQGGYVQMQMRTIASEVNLHTIVVQPAML